MKILPGFFIKILSGLLASSLITTSLLAQTTPTQAQINQAVESGNNQNVDLAKYVKSQTSVSGSQVVANEGTVLSDSTLPLPFGANLFASGIETTQGDGLNPEYLVASGDKISVQLWGTVELAEVLIVDNQGNIFIPQIGPVKVIDIPAASVNQVVTDKIKQVYTNNVNVYVNLLSVTPVRVFVSGPVVRPGQYAGLASDSILYFLKRSGGIDADRGSYRNIKVVRDEQIVKEYDLYEFLRNGKLSQFSFKDNDVILVSEQGASVTVEGAARYPYRFELVDNHSSGEDLIYYSRPLAKTSHVAVTGNRSEGPISVYLPVAQFFEFQVSDGDTVLFNADLQPQVISVKLSGSYLGPSIYSVKKDARLLELLDYIEIDPKLADINSIYIKRKSVALQQKQLLEESLRRLERSIFTAPASSDGESRIRAQEAELVMQFVERARLVEPLGKVVLAADGKVANIRLEQGDEIVIPLKSDLVQVSGEVLLPQAIVFNKQATIEDYIAWAGGYSERADATRIAVVHANGLTTFIENGSDHWFGEGQEYSIQTGDQILVLPRIDTKTLQAVKDITQVIYQIAVAANVALN